MPPTDSAIHSGILEDVICPGGSNAGCFIVYFWNYTSVPMFIRSDSDGFAVGIGSPSTARYIYASNSTLSDDGYYWHQQDLHGLYEGTNYHVHRRYYSCAFHRVLQFAQTCCPESDFSHWMQSTALALWADRCHYVSVNVDFQHSCRCHDVSHSASSSARAGSGELRCVNLNVWLKNNLKVWFFSKDSVECLRVIARLRELMESSPKINRKMSMFSFIWCWTDVIMELYKQDQEAIKNDDMLLSWDGLCSKYWRWANNIDTLVQWPNWNSSQVVARLSAVERISLSKASMKVASQMHQE